MTERKCVCRQSVYKDPPYEICDCFVETKDEYGNTYVHCSKLDCRHSRACHAPASKSKRQNG